MARLSVGDSSVPAALLATWSLFVWGGRLRNLINEPGGLGELSSADRWSLAGSLLFGLLALASLVTLVVAARLTIVPAGMLAALSVIVWAYRAVVIAGRDHSPGFILVHTVLAGVSIGLGIWYLRVSVREQRPTTGGVTRPSESL